MIFTIFPVHMAMTRICLVGHSFVRRIERQGLDFEIDLSRTTVEYCGYVFGRPLNLIEDLNAFIPQFLQHYALPDVVILFMGTNDLGAHPTYSTMGMALQLAAIGKWFLKKGVQRVIFTEVLPRYGFQAFRPCPQFLWQANLGVVTIQDAERLFARRARAFNAVLKLFCKANPQCVFLRWRGLHGRIQTQLVDGIHLTREGMKKLRKALKRTMIVNLQRCEFRN